MEILLGYRIQTIKLYIMKTFIHTSKGRQNSKCQFNNDYGETHVWKMMCLNTKRNLEFGQKLGIKLLSSPTAPSVIKSFI